MGLQTDAIGETGKRSGLKINLPGGGRVVSCWLALADRAEERKRAAEEREKQRIADERANIEKLDPRLNNPK